MALNTKSIDLNGSTQYLSIADANQSGLNITGNYSFECWIKRESTATYMGIINKKSLNGSSYVTYFHSDGRIFSSYSNTGGIDDVIYKTDASYNSTDWQHIAITSDIPTKTITIYVNGSEVAGTYNRRNATAVGVNSQPLWIGVMNSGDSPANFFDGSIDEAIMWNDVRTPTEIAESYNSGDGKTYVGNESGMVGYWRLEDDLLDETSNSNDLTNNGSATYSSDVPFTGSAGTTFIPKVMIF